MWLILNRSKRLASKRRVAPVCSLYRGVMRLKRSQARNQTPIWAQPKEAIMAYRMTVVDEIIVEELNGKNFNSAREMKARMLN